MFIKLRLSVEIVKENYGLDPEFLWFKSSNVGNKVSKLVRKPAAENNSKFIFKLIRKSYGYETQFELFTF